MFAGRIIQPYYENKFVLFEFEKELVKINSFLNYTLKFHVFLLKHGNFNHMKGIKVNSEFLNIYCKEHIITRSRI